MPTPVTTDQMFASMSLTFTRADGTPGTISGVPVWAVSDATVLTVTPSADGLTARGDFVAPGTARFTVTADGDPDPAGPVASITGVSDDIVVSLGTSGFSSVVALTLGAPVPKT